MIAVTCSHRLGLAGLAELLLRVLANRLELTVSRSSTGVFGDHQRLVDKQRELIEDLVALHVGITRDGLGCIEIEPTDEDGEPAEQDAFGLRQQRMRPVHRRPQGLLSAHHGTRATGQQAKAMMQAADDLFQRQGPHAGRGQFDGQRHAVEPTADLGHGGGVILSDGEMGPNPSGPIDEQFDGLVGQRQ